MTYDVRDLYGVWVNLDDNSLLELEEGGDFRLTHADDSPVTDLWAEGSQQKITKFRKKS